MVSDIETHAEVQIIPIAAITVENPRERSEKTFRALVDSIGKVGLKKPITVAQDETASGDPLWDELFPAEQARIVALLVERVDIGISGLNVRLRMDGLAALARETTADTGATA